MPKQKKQIPKQQTTNNKHKKQQTQTTTIEHTWKPLKTFETDCKQLKK